MKVAGGRCSLGHEAERRGWHNTRSTDGGTEVERRHIQSTGVYRIVLKRTCTIANGQIALGNASLDGLLRAASRAATGCYAA